MSLRDPHFHERFVGVTHMMMMGEKHLRVFDVIRDWVKNHISDQPRKNGCAPPRNKED